MVLKIPYSRQEINEEDIAAVVEVLRSDYVTQGPKIQQFENAISSYCQVSNTVVLSSGSAALHCCFAALGVTQGDWVWTSPISFVATSNSALHLGASVDFVDVDAETGNMSIDALKEKLTRAEKNGQLPKVVVPVHFSGRSIELETIKELSATYGFFIVEDAAHSLGANYKDTKPVGCCHYSDATVFSFHPVKSITTGEGGAVTTNDAHLATQIQLYRSHGITRDITQFVNPCTQSWYYEQHCLGFNYRLTDIQAALGISQLKRLNTFIQKRRHLAQRYQTLLSSTVWKIPPPALESAWHLYVIQLPHEVSVTRDSVFQNMQKQGIGVNVHYIPIHLQPYYRHLGFVEGYTPQAESFSKRAISIPIYPSMTEDLQDKVIEALTRSLAL